MNINANLERQQELLTSLRFDLGLSKDPRIKSRTGQVWSEQEGNYVRAANNAGITNGEIAYNLGRTSFAIECKLANGKVEPSVDLDPEFRTLKDQLTIERQQEKVARHATMYGMGYRKMAEFFQDEFTAPLIEKGMEMMEMKASITGCPEPLLTAEQTRTAQLRQVLAIVQDGIKAVECEFTEGGHRYTYKTKLDLVVGNKVVVIVNNARSNNKDTYHVVTVVATHERFNIPVGSNISYRWIVQKVKETKYREQLQKEEAVLLVLKKAEQMSKEDSLVRSVVAGMPDDVRKEYEAALKTFDLKKEYK